MYSFKMLVLICLLTVNSFSDSFFPLVKTGKVLIFAKGSNNRIFPSAANLNPTHVGKVFFSANGNITLSWANLNHQDYASTAELLKDIQKQFSDHDTIISSQKIYQSESPLYIIRNSVRDTLWSVDPVLESANSKYHTLVRVMDGNEEVFKGAQGRISLKKNPRKSAVKPYGYGIRYRQSTDLTTYNVPFEDPLLGNIFLHRSQAQLEPVSFYDNNLKERMTLIDLWTPPVGDPPFLDYCDNNNCYEWLPGYYGEPSNVKFWQIHFKPEIVYYPRNFVTGEPLIDNEMKMNYETALSRKDESIKNPTDEKQKIYRNPFYSDSASCIISIAFAGGSEIAQQQQLLLNSREAGIEADFESYPSRAYIVGNTQKEIERALLKLYETTDLDRTLAVSLDERCPSWRSIDIQNGEKIFPLNKRVDGKNTRNLDINDEIYRYNNCPCKEEPELFGLTPQQARKFIHKPVPTCGISQMIKAKTFYERLKRLLTAEEDQKAIEKRLNTVKLYMKERLEETKNLTNTQINNAENNCRKTWIDKLWN